MIFRLSQKLGTHIKAGPLTPLLLDANLYADWSAHVFSVARTKYVIVCNTKSLYSTVMYTKGINNDNEFIIRALSSIREFMEDDGQQFIYHRLIAPATASVRFGKAFNRSVTSSMNDLISHAATWLTEGGLSPHDVGFKLNDMPFSSLRDAQGRPYAKPREVFKTLLGGAPPMAGE